MPLQCYTCREKNNIPFEEEIVAPFYKDNDAYNKMVAISLRKMPQNHKLWIFKHLNGPTRPTNVGASQIKYFLPPQMLGRAGIGFKKAIGKGGVDLAPINLPNIKSYFNDSIARDPMDSMGMTYTSLDSMFEEFDREFFSRHKNNIKVHDGFSVLSDNNTSCTPDGITLNESNQFCTFECKTY